MTTLRKQEITSLRDYTEFVLQLTDIRWYRGCAASSDLTPSLHRHPVKKDAESLLRLETDILMRFKQRSAPYVTANMRIDNDLDALFIMQHFRVPTRLLDWTENPYIALYFALNDSTYKESNGTLAYTTDVCVWLLDPIVWNNTSLNTEPPPGIIYSLDNELLNAYMPTDTLKNRRPHPVALYGIYNNPRIVVQRGVFTLFGSSTQPMEKIYVRNHYPQDCLLKLTIKKQNVGDMLNSLTRLGVKDSTIFPDLEGLAKELKREFGFLV